MFSLSEQLQCCSLSTRSTKGTTRNPSRLFAVNAHVHANDRSRLDPSSMDFTLLAFLLASWAYVKTRERERSANRSGIPSPSCSVRIFCMSTMYHFGAHLTSGPGVEEQLFEGLDEVVRIIIRAK